MENHLVMFVLVLLIIGRNEQWEQGPSYMPGRVVSIRENPGSRMEKEAKPRVHSTLILTLPYILMLPGSATFKQKKKT